MQVKYESNGYIFATLPSLPWLCFPSYKKVWEGGVRGTHMQALLTSTEAKYETKEQEGLSSNAPWCYPVRGMRYPHDPVEKCVKSRTVFLNGIIRGGSWLVEWKDEWRKGRKEVRSHCYLGGRVREGRGCWTNLVSDGLYLCSNVPRSSPWRWCGIVCLLWISLS